MTDREGGGEGGKRETDRCIIDTTDKQSVGNPPTTHTLRHGNQPEKKGEK